MAFFFNKFKKDKRPDDQVIMSPLSRTQNFFNNSYQMAVAAQSSERNPFVKPVFTDHQQRERFEKRVQKSLSDLNSVDNAKKNKKNPVRDNKIAALKYLEKHSSAKEAQLQIHDQNATVWIQGHGQPGRQTVSSDAYLLPNEEFSGNWIDGDGGDKWKHKGFGSKLQSRQVKMQWQAIEHADVKKTAEDLLAMGAKSSMRLYANSCHSGTQNKVFAPSKDDISMQYKNRKIIDQTGSWDETFAGGVQLQLNLQRGDYSKGDPFNVTGYMGPTTQAPTQVINRKLKTQKQKDFAVSYVSTDKYADLIKKDKVVPKIYVPKNEAMRAQKSTFLGLMGPPAAISAPNFQPIMNPQQIATNHSSSLGNKGRKN